jgi:hypothetical protein
MHMLHGESADALVLKDEREAMDLDDDEDTRQIRLDHCRGQYLCEVCEEAMTDTVLPDPASPGLEIAVCEPCQALVRSGR